MVVLLVLDQPSKAVPWFGANSATEPQLLMSKVYLTLCASSVVKVIEDCECWPQGINRHTVVSASRPTGIRLFGDWQIAELYG